MVGGGEDDSGSLDSDSDLILDGGEHHESNLEDNEEDDSDELEVNEMASEALKNRKSARQKTAVAARANSDEDF
jgi:hypothetical protein